MFDVRLLLFDLALILVMARLFGAAARAVGQPQVVGEIIAGICLGPTLFGGAISRHLFPADLHPALGSVADLGLVLFMFIVGYELDRELIRGRERIAATVSLGSIVMPLVFGFGLGLWLAHRHHVHRTVPFALFVGASMAVTALPIMARILTERGLHRTRIGGLAIASAAVDDLMAWTLLAVVVTIAGATGGDQWHILLSPVYLGLMFWGVRPLLATVCDGYRKAGRLTPDLLAVILVGLLLSCYATDWLGVHYVFGAFIFGTVMPRENAASLRETILERLEQLSVLLLLPVFFVVVGQSINLSKFGGHDAVELLAILGAAVAGKFSGAYAGAATLGMNGRHSAILGTLMNARGVTTIVILTVGLQLKIFDDDLFALMILMALVTTMMTGPLLRVLYPPRLVQRDLADAERAALSAGAAYRVLVVANSLDNTDVIDAALDLAAGRAPAEVLIARLVPQKKTDRLELGSGLGAELLVMTKTLADLHALANRGSGRGVEMRVHAKFSEGELAQDLTDLIIEVQPDMVLLDADTELAPHDFMPRIVRQRSAPPEEITSVALLPGGDAADSAAALRVACEIATARGVELVLVGRRERSAGDLAKRGIRAVAGEVSETTLVIGAVDESGTHLLARARPDEQPETIDDWAGSLSAPTPAGGIAK